MAPCIPAASLPCAAPAPRSSPRRGEANTSHWQLNPSWLLASELGTPRCPSGGAGHAGPCAAQGPTAPRAALQPLTARSQPAVAAGNSETVPGVQTQARPGLPPGDLTASQTGDWLEGVLAAFTHPSPGLQVLGALARMMLAVVVADQVSSPAQ